MKLAHLKIMVLLPLTISFAACHTTVTNNVPAANTSTPPSAQSGSGGVINGGGGKGVLCSKDGKETLEVLDLYEAKSLYGLSLVDFGATEEVAKDKLAQALARHFWNPYNIPMNEYASALKVRYLQQFLDNMRFIEDGKKLHLTNDSYEPVLESGCETVQIATYYDESVLLVDKSLWSKLDWTNKMGLLAHEALYFLARQNGTTNSMGTRKLVGMLFSTKPPQPIASGVPDDKEKFLDCRISSGGFSKGAFFLYRQQQMVGQNGLEAVFSDLGNNGSLFRTSSVIENLSFIQLQMPKYSKAHEATLEKDTYPKRERINLNFKGIVDGKLRADLRFYRDAGVAAGDALDVTCDLPPTFEKLLANNTEPGEFHQKHGDGSVDELKIFANGSLTLEQTRQVGGTGGLTNHGVVPYPTVCRYKQTGMILDQNESDIEYLVISTELGSLDGLKDTQNCQEFVDAANRKAADGSLRYTIRKSEYSKVAGPLNEAR